MANQVGENPQLDILIRLLAVSLTRDLSKREAIELLGRAGMDRQTIADVCQTSAHAVSVVLSEARKRAKKAEPDTNSRVSKVSDGLEDV
jgi:DNA-directed RNA polymerase specialized sigma24 family protein